MLKRSRADVEFELSCCLNAWRRNRPFTVKSLNAFVSEYCSLTGESKDDVVAFIKANRRDIAALWKAEEKPAPVARDIREMEKAEKVGEQALEEAGKKRIHTEGTARVAAPTAVYSCRRCGFKASTLDDLLAHSKACPEKRLTPQAPASSNAS